jgi:hypothetical protein
MARLAARVQRSTLDLELNSRLSSLNALCRSHCFMTHLRLCGMITFAALGDRRRPSKVQILSERPSIQPPRLYDPPLSNPLHRPHNRMLAPRGGSIGNRSWQRRSIESKFIDNSNEVPDPFHRLLIRFLLVISKN